MPTEQPRGRTQTFVAAGAAAGVTAWWLRHYHSNVASPPTLTVADGPLKQVVVPHLHHLHRPYKPPVWGSNTHVQTGLGLLRRVSIVGGFSRHIVLADDGGTVGLDWWCGCDAPAWGPPEAPVMLVCHGINGGSHEGYCKWACAAAAKKGWRSLVLNYRGCNGLSLTSPRGYNATLTADVHLAIKSIKGRFPGAPIFAVGYSLGGMILTKYLGEAGAGFYDHADQPGASEGCNSSGPAVSYAASASACRGPQDGDCDGSRDGGAIRTAVAAAAAASSVSTGGALASASTSNGDMRAQDFDDSRNGSDDCDTNGGTHHGSGRFCSSGLAAAAAVSPPVCMSNALRNLSEPWTAQYVYNLAVAYKLREFIQRHQPAMGSTSPMDVPAALNSWTVQEIDEGMPRQFGFRDRAEYYETASSLQYIPHVDTPTLLLVSTDDPFLGVLPEPECAANPMTLLAQTKIGGHVAFVQGHVWPLGPAFMDDAVLEFFEATLTYLHARAPACKPSIKAKL